MRNCSYAESYLAVLLANTAARLSPNHRQTHPYAFSDDSTDSSTINFLCYTISHTRSLIYRVNGFIKRKTTCTPYPFAVSALICSNYPMTLHSHYIQYLMTAKTEMDCLSAVCITVPAAFIPTYRQMGLLFMGHAAVLWRYVSAAA